MTIECLLKICITKELPSGSFLRTIIVYKGNSCKFKPRKNILVLRQWEDLYSFSKVSKRTNVEWNFNFFTFASQCKLFEFPSYGYNDLFISVPCFLKTTRLSVHRFNLVFFLVSSKVHPRHFSAVAKTLITATEFQKHWKMYICINFSLKNP